MARDGGARQLGRLGWAGPDGAMLWAQYGGERVARVRDARWVNEGAGTRDAQSGYLPPRASRPPCTVVSTGRPNTAPDSKHAISWGFSDAG